MTLASFTAAASRIGAEHFDEAHAHKETSAQDEFSVSIDFRLSSSLWEVKTFMVAMLSLLTTPPFFRKTIRNVFTCSS